MYMSSFHGQVLLIVTIKEEEFFKTNPYILTHKNRTQFNIFLPKSPLLMLMKFVSKIGLGFSMIWYTTHSLEMYLPFTYFNDFGNIHVKPLVSTTIRLKAIEILKREFVEVLLVFKC